MPNVLVAQPMRADLLPVFRQRADEVYASLTYPHKERGLWDKEVKRRPQDPPYTATATVRNAVIDNCLKDHHTHVLWLDADLVTVPADLIERLLEVSEADIVAPLVYVERIDESKPPAFKNGGWFYDTGAFIHNGRQTYMWAPSWLKNEDEIIELDGVGTCYIIPADIFRNGARYEPLPGHIEHYSVMQYARDMGRRVLVRRDTIVEHAYLPHYGDNWHPDERRRLVLA